MNITTPIDPALAAVINDLADRLEALEAAHANVPDAVAAEEVKGWIYDGIVTARRLAARDQLR